MTIKIRERKPKNGQIRLYLEIYDPKSNKKRTSKSLDLYLYEKPSSSQKKSNKEAKDAAEKIRSKMVIDLALSNNNLAELSEGD
ncbi:hypothetical protein [Crocinitomix catalasitica]|uniref:hypothetical protein n=1 Tax=Crocinitomix catalasitica TaxID=184607 RepID=UPI0006879BCD|nr:hypothetical protein [Crocinitomix catalasitica]